MSQNMNIIDPGFHLDGPLRLAEGEVHLWRVDLEAVGGDELRWEELLSADERARASRFHFQKDRQRFVASRAMLRIVLSAYLGTKPAELRFLYSSKEKPALGAEFDISFNVSHSGGVALLAFARRRAIGVDVEQLRSDFDVGSVARRFFSAHEQRQLESLPAADRFAAFFRCWTRKESYVKATGEGLSLPLEQFDVAIHPGAEDALIATRPDTTEATRWLLCDVPSGPGYAAALCVKGRDWQLKSWECSAG